MTRRLPTQQPFCTNRIRTSKYTLLTFLPKNLFEQFRFVANIYFLFLVILQSFPPFQYVSIGLTAAPVIIILIATGVKDALEDWRRHTADQEVNESLSYVLTWIEDTMEPKSIKTGRLDRLNVMSPDDYLAYESPRKSIVPVMAHNPIESFRWYWKLQSWGTIKVGDFVLIRSNEPIPADIVIISTSEPDGNCYVETKNLDGETNLKIRNGVHSLSHIRTPEDCRNLSFLLDVEEPNSLMYAFNAKLTINPTNVSDPPPKVLEAPANRRRSVITDKNVALTENNVVVPININGVLLRGCILRNTAWVIGIVVYTGTDTRLMQNSGKTPSKRSRIDKMLNPQIFLNFGFLFVMCFICGILGAVYQGAFQNSATPFVVTDQLYSSPYTVGVIIFFLSLIIFQQIVPIALYLSIEVAKTCQSLLIHVDHDLYDEKNDISLSPRSWNLCDDLGQVEYIFSDKTGTLTCNEMEFKKATINGVVYGKDYEDDRRGKEMCMGDEQLMRTMLSEMGAKYIGEGPFTCVDPDILRDIKAESGQSLAIRQFFILLALCHTVLAETFEDDPNALFYKAQSPDEGALVEAARDLGFAFLRRQQNKIFVSIFGEEKEFIIQHVIEFNSDRKRMSVIIKTPGTVKMADGDVLLLCKGADSIIYERLSPMNDKRLTDLTLSQLENFADKGLRTLCLAYRHISKEEYEPWATKYLNAQAALADREKLMAGVAEEIEKDLMLMGATAIEDKLQEGVPRCIGDLARAGIKIWVLTGDKMETAINIGFSCNLLKKYMTLIVIKSKSSDEALKQINDALVEFWDANGVPKEKKEFGLIIEGTSLTFVFDEKNPRHQLIEAMLLELGCRCKAVICCRVSPLQKAKVVALVREGLGSLCLAIGDGANDVSMIQEADVGVGISGKEGLQAVMASDFATPQFRFLSKLLVVHGRWAYIRTADMIFLYFYKNMVWLFILFWFQFDCGYANYIDSLNSFSGNIVTEFTYGIFFNTIFTIMPTFISGVLDQDLSARYLLSFPMLYKDGIHQVYYNMEVFWAYVLDAIYQSLILYFLPRYVYHEGVIHPEGYALDLNVLGTVIALSSITGINLYQGLLIYSWTWIVGVAVFASIGIVFLYVCVYTGSKDSPAFGILSVMFQEGHFYLAFMLSIVAALLPRLIFKSLQLEFTPSDSDIVREIQKQNIKSADEEILLYPQTMTGSEVISDHPAGTSTLSAERKATGSDIVAMDESMHLESSESMRRATSMDVVASKSDDEGLNLSQRSAPRSFTMPRILGDRKSSIWRSKEKITKKGKGTLQPGMEEKDDSIPSSEQQTETFKKQMGDIFMQPIATMNEFMRNVPMKLRINTSLRKKKKATTVVFMNSKQQLPNRGFAFSHEDGMGDVIAPERPTFPDEFPDKDEPETSKLGLNLSASSLSKYLRPLRLRSTSTRKKEKSQTVSNEVPARSRDPSKTRRSRRNSVDSAIPEISAQEDNANLNLPPLIPEIRTLDRFAYQVRRSVTNNESPPVLSETPENEENPVNSNDSEMEGPNKKRQKSH